MTGDWAVFAGFLKDTSKHLLYKGINLVGKVSR